MRKVDWMPLIVGLVPQPSNISSDFFLWDDDESEDVHARRVVNTKSDCENAILFVDASQACYPEMAFSTVCTIQLLRLMPSTAAVCAAF